MHHKKLATVIITAYPAHFHATFHEGKETLFQGKGETPAAAVAALYEMASKAVISPLEGTKAEREDLCTFGFIHRLERATERNGEDIDWEIEAKSAFTFDRFAASEQEALESVEWLDTEDKDCDTLQPYAEQVYALEAGARLVLRDMLASGEIELEERGRDIPSNDGAHYL